MPFTANQLPFPIGQYMTCAAATDQPDWEGKEFEVPDLDYTQGTSPGRARAYTNGVQATKVVRCVRNVSGRALLPRYMVTYKSSAIGYQVDGFSRTTAQRVAGVVDEFVVSTGVPNNALFYVVRRGPAECYTSAAANAEDVFSAGSMLMALTAAASTDSTTAGRVIAFDGTGVTETVLGLRTWNIVGEALSASTTAETNTAKLVRMMLW